MPDHCSEHENLIYFLEDLHRMVNVIIKNNIAKNVPRIGNNEKLTMTENEESRGKHKQTQTVIKLNSLL